MEKTELREQFFAAARSDPYVHAVMNHAANAWAEGYEQALRDNGLTEQRLRESHHDRVNRALDWMTDARNKAQAQAIIAFAEIGKLMPQSWKP
jgi:hypothetical protein